MFDDETTKDNIKFKTHKFKVREIPLNIAEGAMENFNVLKFSVLKSYFPNLVSRREFLQSDNYLGNITLQIDSPFDKIRAEDLYDGAMKIFRDISGYIQKIQTEYEGTREFFANNICDVLKNKKIYIDNPHGEGVGISQLCIFNEDRLDLTFEPWYVYNDNYGTSEEKAFVKYFKGIVDDLRKKYDEIYLVRNERIAALAIYEFDTGERFEPDFLLFLQKKGTDGYLQEQIYIEPKGGHLLEKDKWKEEFLLKIEELGIPTKIYADDNEYRIIGLPFFNKELRMREFEDNINEKIL